MKHLLFFSLILIHFSAAAKIAIQVVEPQNVASQESVNKSEPAAMTSAKTIKVTRGKKKKARSKGPGLAETLAPMMNAMKSSKSSSASEIPADATASSYADLGGSVSSCHPGISVASCWTSARSVERDIIPAGGGYNINASAWPKLARAPSGQWVVNFPSRQSMCTSATAAAFLKYIADMANVGRINLQNSHVNQLNGPVVRELLNGNTYSFALLNQYLGGQNTYATGAGEIANALKQAKSGDVLKYDRDSGTGHSTIFKEIKGNQFCYWSSNSKTNGVGVRCEPISSLKGVAISRLTLSGNAITAGLESLNSPKLRSVLAKTDNGSVPASAVNWSGLTCNDSGPEDSVVADRGVASESAEAAN